MSPDFQEVTQVPIAEVSPQPRASAQADLSDFTFGMSRADLLTDASGQPLDPSLNPDRKHQIRSVQKENLAAAAALHRYDDRTVELLASYFAGKIAARERTELSGRLVFPGNQEAASLLALQLSGGSSPEQDAALTGAAMFPDNRRVAELYAIRLTGQRVLTLPEQVEIYSHQLFRDSPTLMGLLSKEMVKILTPLHEGKLSEEQIKRLLVNFVRRELELCEGVASSPEELEAFFGMKKGAVEALLTDPKDGLQADLAAQRTERLLMASEQPKQALTKLRVHALRNIVKLENDLHRGGVVDVLSTGKDLADLLGLSQPALIKLQRLIFDEDRAYRDRLLQKLNEFEQRALLVDSVRRELAAHRSGKVAQIRTDKEIGEAFGQLLPISVHHLLKLELGPAERRYRDYALRSSGAMEDYSRSAVSYARAEIEAFKLGQAHSLTTNADLAASFNVDARVIEQSLRDPAGGLALEERKMRDFVIGLQKPHDPSAEAFRDLSGVYVRESIERQLNRSDSADIKAAKPKAPEPEAETDARPRNKVNFRGLRFDSYEEAVCTVMLAKYVRGFEPIEGRTFQVPVGNRFVDFIVKGAVVEYHPILPFWAKSGLGSFKSRDDYDSFNRIKMSIRSSERRNMFVEETKARLADEYRDEREKILAESPQHKNSELIVALSAEDFYYSVLRRFGENVPSKALFMREFNKIKARVRRENS